MTPIERAASAAMQAMGDGPGSRDRLRAEAIVRAVLQALREPSEGMLESFGIHKSRMRQNYQAMIDAALSE